MITINIVGAGSLGAGYALELCRRSHALGWPLNIRIFDFDEVEERNLASQDFFPKDLGRNKAEVIAERCSEYPSITAEGFNTKITAENINDVLSSDYYSIVVDAVDNLEARHLLWTFSHTNSVPVQHLGMTTQGSGQVSWNYMTHVDTFPLSPISMSLEAQENVKNAHEEKKPPCVLNSFRTLITNTYMSGVNSLYIFMGKDTLELVSEVIDGETYPLKETGTATTWYTQIDGFRMEPLLTKKTVWPISEQDQFIKETLAKITDQN